MRRPSAALIVASIAVFVALGDVAMGATHYLITSKKQISPKVIRALRGPAGKPGPAGPAGPPGSAGASGGGGPLTLTYVSTSFPYKFDAATPGTLACPSGSFPVAATSGLETNESDVEAEVDPQTGFKFSVLDDAADGDGGTAYVFGVCASGPGLTAVDASGKPVTASANGGAS